MPSPAEQLASALAATLEDYSRSSRPRPFPVDGWHAGARFGATAAWGRIAAYNDSGAEGVCILQDGQGVWLNVQPDGHSRDFAQRPYSIWEWMPSYNGQPTWLIGALAPEAARLELVSEDGTVVEADVVDQTFAVEKDVDMVCLRHAKERLEAAEPDSEEGRAEFNKLMSDSRTEMSKVRVRVYDSAEVLLYHGPSIDPGTE